MTSFRRAAANREGRVERRSSLDRQRVKCTRLMEKMMPNKGLEPLVDEMADREPEVALAVDLAERLEGGVGIGGDERPGGWGRSGDRRPPSSPLSARPR